MSENSIESAKALLEADKLRRVQSCLTEINEVLERHACRLVPYHYFEDGKDDMGVKVFTNDLVKVISKIAITIDQRPSSFDGHVLLFES